MWAIGAVVALLVAGCGDDGERGATGTTVAGGRGWLGGEPDWDGGEGAGSAEDAGGVAPVGDSIEGESMAATSGAATDEARTGEAVDGALRAGSVDDNERFDDFLAYLQRLRDAGIVLRDHDPTGRIVATVTGTSGRPVAGAEVVITTGGTEVARLRTTADGTVRFHPAVHGGAADAGTFELASGGATVTAAPGDAVAITSDAEGGATAPVALDVVFLLDATGSMGDEIDRLRTSIDSVAERIAALEPAPDVRFGMTLYRDEGDAFVTSTYDLTSDLAAFRAALADVQAGGGGDYPEALDEALAEALSAPAWRDPATTIQLVFLVADAPPQVGRDVPVPYTESIVEAMERGAKVVPIASSESDDQAEGVFRTIAQATGARFVFLSYGAAGAATGASTDIDATDYEELALDDLVVRLVAEELDALTGGDTPVPTTTTSTTAPQGQ